MKRIEFMKQMFDYLDSIKKPFDKLEEIETLRWVIGMIEDCLTWEVILKHLTEGCHCREFIGEEAKRALEADLEK